MKCKTERKRVEKKKKLRREKQGESKHMDKEGGTIDIERDI